VACTLRYQKDVSSATLLSCLTSCALLLLRRAEDGIPTLRALLERQSPRETKIHRAAAFTLVALGRGLHSFPFLLNLSLPRRFPLNLS